MAKRMQIAKGTLQPLFEGEAASGVVLLVAAGAALVWANSPWADGYAELWHAQIALRFGSFAFKRPLEWFVNDGLMTIFFFVAGLEIRREMHAGALSDVRRAALPVIAAAGGMLAPAVLYLALAGGPSTRAGWGIPMATDIAFAVGVLALLGRRVPQQLRVLLLALAIIDDLGAILVIAVFYSAGIYGYGLLAAAIGVVVILALRASGVRSFAAYVVPAGIVWAGVGAAGIHPTVAGVIVGLLTPVRAWLGPEGPAKAARDLASPGARDAASPADYLIEALHPWVTFLIMPIFALANAGVDLRGISLSGAAWNASLAITVALVLGKPLGVVALGTLALRTGFAALPEGLNLRHLLVLGAVAGIGFTMSLFIAQLAFTDVSLLGAAKLGVLCASAIAMLMGLVLGRSILPLSNVDQGTAAEN